MTDGFETVLVTGASGFLGSALLKRLALRQDINPIGVYRTFPESLPEGISAVVADFRKPGWTEALPETATAVVHLAQSRRYRDFPECVDDLIAVNIDSTTALLDWGRRNGIKTFVFASSGNVYAPSENPVDEGFPCGPGSMYGATKYAGELIASQYVRFFCVVALRIYCLYGPAQRQGLVRSMIDCVKSGDAITLDGGEGLTTSPLFVDDAADAVERVLNVDHSMDRLLYNLGGHETVTLREVVDTIATLLDRTPNISVAKEKPVRLLANSTRFYKEFDFKPSVSLLEGLRRTVASENLN